MSTQNIFAKIPSGFTEEAFEEIIREKSFKLERIISKGHATPEGEWYDQDKNEWVMLLKGSAGLLIEGEKEVKALKPGDYMYLPAHARHRVEWTDPEEETIWLALHFESGAQK